MNDAATRQQSEAHQLLCQINDELFSALVGVVHRPDPTSAMRIAAAESDGERLLAQENFYFYMFTTLSPVMPPPSVTTAERRGVLRTTIAQREETVQALMQERIKELNDGLRRSSSRRERLVSVCSCPWNPLPCHTTSGANTHTECGSPRSKPCLVRTQTVSAAVLEACRALQAEEIIRNKIARARETEWIGELLETATSAGHAFVASPTGQSL